MIGPTRRKILTAAPAIDEAAIGTPVVEVLLSTYRGARFLPEQLRSIEAQSLAPRRILVRDDGSDDGTYEMLSTLAGSAQYRLLPQTRLGSTESYFELLRTSSANADYIAFADQDDVWKAGKLDRAVSMLRSAVDKRTPALYCSRAEIVDEQLRPLGLTPLAPYHPSLANALVQNIAMGCTIVMNRAARDLVCQSAPPSWVFHDWWCYLTVSAFGTVVFDPEPTILYRQHSRNLVGISPTILGRFCAGMRRQFSGKRALSLVEQARAFDLYYGERLATADKKILKSFVDDHAEFRSRVRHLGRAYTYRQSRFQTFAMRCLYIVRNDF